MRKIIYRKRAVLSVFFAAALMFCAGMVCFTASANEIGTETVAAFRMMDGASVRLDAEENGLRFTAELGQESPAEGLEYHIMIFPAVYMERFSMTEESDFVSVLTGNEATYLDMVADPFQCPAAENGMQEGYWYVRGSVTSIKYENINGVFFGIAYAENAEGERTYAAYSDGANERDVVYVASAALSKGGFAPDSAEYGILQTLITRGINKANAVPEESKDNAYQALAIAETLSLPVGKEQTLEIENLPAGTNIYKEWSASGCVSVDENGKVTANEIGAGAVTLKILDQTFTCNVTVDKEVIETETDIVLNQKDDLEKDFTYSVEGSVQSVSINGTVLENTVYSAEEGLLTIPYETLYDLYGENKLVLIETDLKTYRITADIITYLITDKSDLNAGTAGTLSPIRAAGGATTTANSDDAIWNGYFVLANDIDFAGDLIINSDNQTGTRGFKGTFDGRGYTISDFTLQDATSFFGGVARDAVIKNVAFIGAKLSDKTLQYPSLGFLGYASLVVRMENVYIEAETYIASNAMASGMFGLAANATAKLKNTFIDCTFVLNATVAEDVTSFGALVKTPNGEPLHANSRNVKVITNVTLTEEGDGPYQNVTKQELSAADVSAAAGSPVTIEGKDSNVVSVFCGLEDVTARLSVNADDVTFGAEVVSAYLAAAEDLSQVKYFVINYEDGTWKAVRFTAAA